MIRIWFSPDYFVFSFLRNDLDKFFLSNLENPSVGGGRLRAKVKWEEEPALLNYLVNLGRSLWALFWKVLETWFCKGFDLYQDFIFPCLRALASAQSFQVSQLRPSTPDGLSGATELGRSSQQRCPRFCDRLPRSPVVSSMPAFGVGPVMVLVEH